MSLPLHSYQTILWQYLHPQRGKVLLLAALLLTGIGLQLTSPQVISAFIDGIEGGQAMPALVRLALLLLGITALLSLVKLAQTYVSEAVGWTATNQLRADLTRHCLHLDISFHNSHTPGELIERVDGDVSQLAHFFAKLVIEILGNLLLMFGILIVLWWENWQIGLAFTLFAALTFGGMARLRNFATRQIQAERAASAALFGFLEERLGATEDLRANGAVAYTVQRLFGVMRDFWRKSMQAATRSAIFGSLVVVWFEAGAALALALGAFLFLGGTLSLGTVFLLYSYVLMLMEPLMLLSQEMQNLQEASGSLLRIEELYQTPRTIHDGVGAELPAGPLAVEFADVLFAYGGAHAENSHDGGTLRQAQGAGADDGRSTLRQAQGADGETNEGRTLRQAQGAGAGDGRSTLRQAQGAGSETAGEPVGESVGELVEPVEPVESPLATRHPPPALHAFSYHLAPGRKLGLLGRTGSGKTTLTRLLLRLYDPQQGVIRLGGVDLRDLRLADLRASVGIVTQEVQLFQATVRENLTLFDPAIPDPQIITVLGDLGLGDWLATLPQGLDTQLASGGGLSAGQAQLFALARIFLRNPGLVILDEASSRLDPATEHLLERAIERLLHNRTAIVIAHRLTTVQRVDDIVILDNGRIAEAGSRAQLAADATSHFARLLQSGLEAVNSN